MNEGQPAADDKAFAQARKALILQKEIDSWMQRRTDAVPEPEPFDIKPDEKLEAARKALQALYERETEFRR